MPPEKIREIREIAVKSALGLCFPVPVAMPASHNEPDWESKVQASAVTSSIKLSNATPSAP